MRKQYLRILIALIGVAGLGMAAKAQVVDQIVVTIPFEFVAAGKTLPAGTYKVNRLSDDRFAGLVLSSFETAGDAHFLSKIKTADNVYNIQVPRAAILLASGKSQTATASGSAAGSN